MSGCQSSDRNFFQYFKLDRAIADISSELFLLGFADSTQPTRSAIALAKTDAIDARILAHFGEALLMRWFAILVLGISTRRN
jgi:hypothetical protein